MLPHTEQFTNVISILRINRKGLTGRGLNLDTYTIKANSAIKLPINDINKNSNAKNQKNGNNID